MAKLRLQYIKQNLKSQTSSLHPPRRHGKFHLLCFIYRKQTQHDAIRTDFSIDYFIQRTEEKKKKRILIHHRSFRLSNSTNHRCNRHQNHSLLHKISKSSLPTRSYLFTNIHISKTPQRLRDETSFRQKHDIGPKLQHHIFNQHYIFYQ